MAEQEQKYTTRVIEAINKASEIAKDKSLPTLDVPELLRALYDQEDSFYVNILKKLDIDPKEVSQLIDEAISSSVKTTSTSDPEASSDVKNILYNASKIEKAMDDEYMSVEHLLLAQFDCRHSLIMQLEKIPSYDKKTFKKRSSRSVATTMSLTTTRKFSMKP